jgi:hypothetical protein
MEITMETKLMMIYILKQSSIINHHIIAWYKSMIHDTINQPSPRRIDATDMTRGLFYYLSH